MLLLQFFQSRSVRVNYGTSVRRPLYWPFEHLFDTLFPLLKFFPSFQVQRIVFLRDALIARLCLNFSGKIEE